MLTRRQFVHFGAIIGFGASLPGKWFSRQAFANDEVTQIPRDGRSIPQFIEPLPSLHTIVAGDTPIELQMTEFQTQVSLAFPEKTWVWGYREPGQPDPVSYLGPIIIAQRGTPTEIKWVNDLGDASDSHVLAWKNSTDQSVHWADPLWKDREGEEGEYNYCAEKVEPNNPATGFCADHYDGSIPAVAHLHGGEVPPKIDGGPDAWFTSDGAYKGRAFYSRDGADATNYAIYRYPNAQEAATLWFHDHGLGVTRLSVYAGLAGAYLITDPANPPLVNLPEEIIPLIIQDRMFDTNGQLYFPNVGINPQHPYWIPEFVGDTILVNGKPWPFLNVEPKRYRFLFLNGANARAYEMFLVNPVTKAPGPAIWQIGTDGGYLDQPVKIDLNAPKGQLQKLVLLPGERADVIIDFAGLAGTTLLLRNTAKTPYPGGEAPHGKSTGRIMVFRVSLPLSSPDTSYDPTSGAPLRTPMVRLVNPHEGTLADDVTVQKIRQLTLNEVIGEGGPLELLLNNSELPGTNREDFTAIIEDGISTYYSELPTEGETEIWELVNLTADTHPIHLHLVQFQLMNRQAFNLKQYEAAYLDAFGDDGYLPGAGPPLHYDTGNPRALGGNPDITPFLKGPVRLPAPNEAGWKDTVQVPPGQVTRLVVRWAPTDLPADTSPDEASASYPFDPDHGHGYVWHCHILDHEDNEMMRPISVTSNPAVEETDRSYVQGTDY